MLLFSSRLGCLRWGSLNAATAAVVSSPDFEVIETAEPGNTGFCTVINNSVAEYIYGLSVTNPFASSVNNWTTEPGSRRPCSAIPRLASVI